MTATGSGLFELLDIASGEGSAATVVSLLRRPGRAQPRQVDWLGALGPQGAHADCGRSPWRMGRRGRGPAPDLGPRRSCRGRRRCGRDRRCADPVRRRRRREAPQPLGARPVRGARDRAASRDRGREGPRRDRRSRRSGPQRYRRPRRTARPRAGTPLAWPDGGPGADPQPVSASRDAGRPSVRRRPRRRDLPRRRGRRPAPLRRATPGPRPPVPQRSGRRGALPVLRMRVEARGLSPPLLPGERRGGRHCTAERIRRRGA